MTMNVDLAIKMLANGGQRGEEGSMKQRHPKVLHWDDERSVGDRIIVTLKHGWQWGSSRFDPSHVRGFDTVREAREALRDYARPCRCQRCAST